MKSIYNFAKESQSLSSYSSTFSSYTATLYVFPGCKDAYSSADVWKNFTIVEKDMITGVEEVKVAESNDSSYVIYDVNGKIVSSLKHGVNILSYANGKVKKVMIK